jgi:hypothetical protein
MPSKQYDTVHLRAFGFALGILHVPIARARVLVAICPWGNALARAAADPAIL